MSRIEAPQRHDTRSLSVAASYVRSDAAVRAYILKHSGHLLDDQANNIKSFGLDFKFTTMSANWVNNPETAHELHVQAETHLQMAALFAAFCFAGLAQEASLDPSPHAACLEGDGSADLSEGPLFEQIPRWDCTAHTVADQVLFCVLALAMSVHVVCCVAMMNLQLFLTTAAGKEYFRTLSGFLGRNCLLFNYGATLMMFSVPLYAYKRFDLAGSVLFGAIVFLWFLKSQVKMVVVMGGLFNLLVHLSLGIVLSPEEATLKPSSLGKPEGAFFWKNEAMAEIVRRRKMARRATSMQSVQTFQRWTCAQVSAFLQREAETAPAPGQAALTKAADAVAQHSVAGSALEHLGHEGWRELGLGTAVERAYALGAVQKLAMRDEGAPTGATRLGPNPLAMADVVFETEA